MNPDNIYLNVTFNHDSRYGNAPSPAVYNVTKNTPIINKCNDYYCSVIRFDIPLDQIPLFIMPSAGEANINITPLKIGIFANDGTLATENIIFIPNGPFIVPSPQQSATSPYFYVFSIDHLIDMVNNALAAAYVIAYPGHTLINCPFFNYDPTTELISINYPDGFITNVNTRVSYIIMNNELSTFLDGFYTKSNGDNNANGSDYEFIFDGMTINLYQDINGIEYYKNTQEYNVVPMWAQLRKIVIVTSSIPTFPEYVQLNSNLGNNTSLRIVTDFVLSFNQAGESRSLAVYNSTSQYRLIDLLSDSSLYTIDLQIFWIDRLGNTLPLMISVYQQASIKMAFLKKDLYKKTMTN